MTGRERRDNLPAEVSSFVGRRREISEVRRLLSVARLVTLTGVGGVGKSRLALAAAAEVRRSFRDGVWLVDLATLRDPALLSHTIADALGLTGRTTAHDLVVAHLREQRLLVVLDNCAHLVEACARVAGELLAAAPELRILATSRQPLRIPGEHVLSVAPLPVPDDSPDLSPDDPPLGANDAVRLFIDRARAAIPDLNLDADGYRTVARICQRLDGLPLAIELAAARLRVLAPAQVLDGLDDCLRLLTVRDRAAPAWQRTIRDAVGWSYDLATERERTLWARLSVFAGPFDLEAAEGVCAGAGLPRAAILDLVTALVDQSVLMRSDDGATVRYRMLAVIRQYGQAALARDEQAAQWRRRHRDYHLALAVRAENGWFSADQSAWCARLHTVRADLRTALDYSLSDPHLGLTMATALWRYWLTGGALSEGQHWLRRALALATEPTPARAKALWALGAVTHIRGDHDAARRELHECRALADTLGYGRATAYAVQYLAGCALAEGDHAGALELYEDALSRHRASGDQTGVTTTLSELALCYCLRGDARHGDLDHARALSAECIRRCAAVGESWCRSYALYVDGLARWLQGDPRAAEHAVRESVRLKHRFEDVIGIGTALELLACVAASDDRHERAARLIGTAQQIWRDVQAPLSGIEFLLACRRTAEARSRARLGDRVFDRIAGEGATLGLALAVEYALGETGDSPVPADRQPATVLTQRERQISDMVAAGLSNKQIAARLVISQRTAESHVQHILTKLGFTSRAQIATWVARRR
ncbi:LuxR C-terminal-related transcriptional regulator [Actinomycetes bacterium KLBMP 9797]